MALRVGQIALVVTDILRSTDFYAQVFGLDPVFGTSEFRGPEAERVQGIRHVASSTHWLIDDRSPFQLELFQFEHPRSRLLHADHGITDQGYNRVIIAVKSLDITSEVATANGAKLLALLCSERSELANHALLQDPDGILLELVEDPSLVPGERPARIVGLGITSGNLQTTVEDMCEGFGFVPCGDKFQHQGFWQEGGRLQDLQTLRLADMYLVVSQYRDSRPRSGDHSLGDIGIMNFALYYPTQSAFADCYRRTVQMGMVANCEPLTVGDAASITYNNDRQGFSVEMMYMADKLWGLYGFSRPSLRDRLVNKWLNLRARLRYRQQLSRRPVE